MIYNNRAGDGVTITSPAFNVSRETMTMKASKLIKRLNKLMKEHGDLPVHRYNNDGFSVGADVKIVHAYTAEGCTPFKPNSAVEIYIH
jgi:hypothetical protein